MPAATPGLKPNLFLAIAYALAGCFVPWFTLNGGYSSAVWPPSGIALAALLIWGRGLWSGVWLGATCLNLYLSWDGANPSSIASTAALAVLTGAGATLQALFATTAIRRWCPDWEELSRERTIALLLILGGPVACLIGASWSTTMLYLFRGFELADWPRNWLTWWTGDTVGVVIFMPLIVLWTFRDQSYRRRAWIVAVPLLIAYLFVIGGSLGVRLATERDARKLFAERSDAFAAEVQRRVDSATDSLNVLRSFYLESHNVDAAEFRNFARVLGRDAELIQTFDWIPKIEFARLENFIAEVRAEGQPAYVVLESDPQGGLRPAARRAEYFPIRYSDPPSARDIRGMDLAADPLIARALKIARDEGEAAATAPFSLLRELDGKRGMLLLAPVVRPPDDRNDGYAKPGLDGFVAAAIRFDRLLSRLPAQSAETMIVGIRDADAPPENGWLGTYDGVLREESPAPADVSALNLRRVIRLPGDRRWILELTPTPEFLAAASLGADAVLLVGMPLAGMLGAFLLILTGRTNRIERIVLDRTDQLQSANAELALARHMAESSTRAKSDFLANMSHELRTPMTAILGFAEILSETIPPGEDRRRVETIRRNGDYLLGILNDILDLSKIEAGKLQIESLECDPEEIVLETLQMFGPQIRKKGLELEVALSGPLPKTFPGDPMRWRQILTNLLGNALKFTSSGKIRIEVRYRDGQPCSRRFEFEIRDSGIGMTREQLAKLFRPFAQADTSTTRRFGGTGLGLTISQRLAHMMGGEIRVASEPHVGSVFTFSLQPARDARFEFTTYDRLANAPTEWLPDDQSSPPDAIPTDTEPERELLPGLKILLVEDGPDNRRLIEHLLKKFGAIVETAENGALACAKILGDRERFDVILMDMQMPVMDGYDATARLRETGCTTPIIALTANAMSSDREKCLAAGCNDYLTKPIDRATLLATLRNQIRPRLEPLVTQLSGPTE